MCNLLTILSVEISSTMNQLHLRNEFGEISQTVALISSVLYVFMNNSPQSMCLSSALGANWPVCSSKFQSSVQTVTGNPKWALNQGSDSTFREKAGFIECINCA